MYSIHIVQYSMYSTVEHRQEFDLLISKIHTRRKQNMRQSGNGVSFGQLTLLERDNGSASANAYHMRHWRPE